MVSQKALMQMRLVIFFTLLIECVLYPLFGGTNWDLEYWQYLSIKNFKSGPYQLSTIGEMRLHQVVSNVYYYRISENFAYKALPYLDLEVHYSYIYNKSKGATRFNNTSRLEFEVNPFMTLRNGVTLKWRNRIELLKKHGVSHIQFVGRQRILLAIPIKSHRFLSAIQAYDEIHYDFDTNRFTQNRFVPIELSFILKKETTLDLFLMLRNFYAFSLEQWSRSIVVGAELGF